MQIPPPAAPGKIIAINGPSSSGKTTLALAENAALRLRAWQAHRRPSALDQMIQEMKSQA